jgi:hypothetical protein
VIRNLIVSIWIAGLTLASAYFGSQMQRGMAGADQAGSATPPTSIVLKSITVPVIASGAIQGYVLTQITVSTKTALLKSVPQPAELALSDAVFKTIYAEDQIDFQHLKKQDLSKLSKKIVDTINIKAGAPLAEEVFIQELHYISKRGDRGGNIFRH